MELMKRFIDCEQLRLDEMGCQVFVCIQLMKIEIFGEVGMEDLIWGLLVFLKCKVR